MDTSQVCQHCGKPLGSKAVQGMCPECLLRAGVESGTGTAPGASRSQFTPPLPSELAPHFPALELLERIGQGGMGAVYKAVQKNLDRLVALKVLPPQLASDPAFAERFNREARALARLNHPSIVVVYDFGQAGGYYFVLMEYVHGLNLRQLLASKRLSAREALAIVPQICEALQYAHDRGVVHRDIKPENILIDAAGRVKIADFGLAKLVAQDQPPSHLTESRQILGTPNYMAPEQIEKPEEVDHRADLYSLGVVFYEMLTGELPLGRFQPPSEKVHVDVRLDEIVLRALEKEPRRRYQQASEIKTEVETVAVTSAPVAKPASRSRNQKQKGWMWVTLGVLALLLVVLIYQFAFPRASRAPEPRSAETEATAAHIISLAAVAPVIVRTVPVAGSTNVDPALSEIHVTFSKPMQDGSWSWSTFGNEYYPRTTGSPHYLPDGRTCVLPVKLEPGRTYAIWLNSSKFQNFTDRHGQPAVPYLLVFATKP